MYTLRSLYLAETGKAYTRQYTYCSPAEQFRAAPTQKRGIGTTKGPSDALEGPVCVGEATYRSQQTRSYQKSRLDS